MAELLFDEYVFPSIHVYGAHSVLISVPIVEFSIVKSRETTESHPLELSIVSIAVVFDDVFFCQTYDSTDNEDNDQNSDHWGNLLGDSEFVAEKVV